jgi:histidinol-phosphatase (PHP family)
MPWSELHKIDCHVHPDYSLDATGSIDQYCRRALELGLQGICFTTHYDADPARKEIDPFMRMDGKIVSLSEESVKIYIADVRRAAEEYGQRGLSVKVGLEVDYAPHIEEQLKRDLAAFDLDCLLGAVHCLDHIAITAKDEAETYFKRKSAEEMVSEYFRNLEKAARSGLFDVVAHLDIYKKYGLSFYGEKILSAHRGLVEPVLEAMAKSDLGMEINAGVLRKGHSEFSPGSEITQMALNMGVRIAGFGSDAHKVEQLGRGIEEAYHLVERLNRDVKVRGNCR